MRRIHRTMFAASSLAVGLFGCAQPGTRGADPATRIAFVIHGGAGVLSTPELTPERRREIVAALHEACRTGQSILESGGTALDAVTAAVVFLEDDPHFNAGRGAVFTHDGHCELDAALAEGHTRRAGAVAALMHVKNPIRLARAVMEHSEHVMLIGAGAEAFAQERGLELVDNTYFQTEFRRQQLEKRLLEEKANAMRSTEGGPSSTNKPYGTVGAVALDRFGHLAAATSTGGMTNKRYGRVGDAPILGAGTYADGEVAVSATGWGEYFIRLGVAHEVAARCVHRHDPLSVAAQSVIDAVGQLGGDGGLIALDRSGNLAMPYNSEGMYRAWIDSHGVIRVAIHGDEESVADRTSQLSR